MQDARAPRGRGARRTPSRQLCRGRGPRNGARNDVDGPRCAVLCPACVVRSGRPGEQPRQAWTKSCRAACEGTRHVPSPLSALGQVCVHRGTTQQACLKAGSHPAVSSLQEVASMCLADAVAGWLPVWPVPASLHLLHCCLVPLLCPCPCPCSARMPPPAWFAVQPTESLRAWLCGDARQVCPQGLFHSPPLPPPASGLPARVYMPTWLQQGRPCALPCAVLPSAAMRPIRYVDGKAGAPPMSSSSTFSISNGGAGAVHAPARCRERPVSNYSPQVSKGPSSGCSTRYLMPYAF